MKRSEFVLDDFACVVNPAGFDLFFDKVIALFLFEFTHCLILDIAENFRFRVLGDTGVRMRGFIEISINDFGAIQVEHSVFTFRKRFEFTHILTLLVLELIRDLIQIVASDFGAELSANRFLVLQVNRMLEAML